MRYRVIMGMQLDAEGAPPPDKQQAILTRRKKFKNYDVLNDRVQIKYLETQWSLNILIVGTEHLKIGFPALTGDREVVMSLRISDRSFVERVVHWYDEHLWNAKAAKDVTWTGGIL